MTDSTAPAGDLVAEDLRRGLPEFELTAFQVEEDLVANEVEVVAWQATLKLVHDFHGVPKGADDLPLRGVTFVKPAADGSPSFRRYIDWLDLFNRLGLNGAMRPVGAVRRGAAAGS